MISCIVFLKIKIIFFKDAHVGLMVFDRVTPVQATHYQQLGHQVSDDEFASAEEDNRDLCAHMTRNKKSQANKTSSATKAVPGDVSHLLSKRNSKGSKE